MPNQDFDFKKTGRFIGWCSKCAHEGISDSGMPCGRCIARSHGNDGNMPLYFLPKGDAPIVYLQRTTN